jgi:hypothetical protein
MVQKNIKQLISLFTLLIVLAACTANIEDVKEKAIDSAKMAFMDPQEKTNEKSGEIAFYKPADYKVIEEKKHNILLEKDDNPIIIFINPNENETSKAISDSMEKNKEDYIAQETFKQEGRIGVIAIKELKKEKYELVVAVGGVKVTTQTDLKQLNEFAEEMMKIASSIKQ